MTVGESRDYFFPSYTDENAGDTHTETIEVDGGSLPSFITEDGFGIAIAPVSSADAGSYTVTVEVKDSDNVLSGTRQIASGSFTVTILASECYTGTYADASVTVLESVSVDVSGFDAGACSDASFEFLVDGGGLLDFMTTSGSALTAAPTLNLEAGEYLITVEATYLGETKTMDTFTLTVLEIDETEELEASEDESGETSGATTSSGESKYLSNLGLSIKVDYTFALARESEPLSVRISEVE